MEYTTKFFTEVWPDGKTRYRLHVYNEHGLLSTSPFFKDKDACIKYLIETYERERARERRDIDALQRKIEKYDAMIDVINKAE